MLLIISVDARIYRAASRAALRDWVRGSRSILAWSPAGGRAGSSGFRSRRALLFHRRIGDGLLRAAIANSDICITAEAASGNVSFQINRVIEALQLL